MDSELSPELRTLCERASRELDPAKLLELTKQIIELLEQQNAERSYNRVMGNRLEVERLGTVKGYTVLCFKGPLTMENVFVFRSAIKREENLPTVILDFSDVPYMDSTALGALVSAYVSRQKLGRRVVLSGIGDRVSKMLKITSVDSLFLTFPTREDAIGGLSGAGAA
jgi:anti-sigma B factor antagonist